MVSALPELNPDSLRVNNLLGICPHAVACVARYDIDWCKTNPRSSRRTKKQLVGLSPDCGGNEPSSGQEQIQGLCHDLPGIGPGKGQTWLWGPRRFGRLNHRFGTHGVSRQPSCSLDGHMKIQACDWEGWQAGVSFICNLDKIMSHVKRR